MLNARMIKPIQNSQFIDFTGRYQERSSPKMKRIGRSAQLDRFRMRIPSTDVVDAKGYERDDEPMEVPSGLPI